MSIQLWHNWQAEKWAPESLCVFSFLLSHLCPSRLVITICINHKGRGTVEFLHPESNLSRCWSRATHFPIHGTQNTVPTWYRNQPCHLQKPDRWVSHETNQRIMLKIVKLGFARYSQRNGSGISWRQRFLQCQPLVLTLSIQDRTWLGSRILRLKVSAKPWRSLTISLKMKVLSMVSWDSAR